MTQVIPADGGLQTPVDLDALAASAGIAAEHVIPYGRDVAKIDLHALDPDDQPNDGASGAHYVVVTAITPTPFGEGKTTTAIGLAQGLVRLGQRAVLTLRQSAMGPTFGIKGGAGGSGRAPPLMPKVGPMADWRRVRTARWPRRTSPWASPIAVVVLPSPKGVGVIAVTTT